MSIHFTRSANIRDAYDVRFISAQHLRRAFPDRYEQAASVLRRSGWLETAGVLFGERGWYRMAGAGGAP